MLVKILKEAAKVEEVVAGETDVTGVISDELQTRYKACADCIKVIDKGLVAYKEEMVPVFKADEEYFVEMDNVVKYMESCDVKDIKEAMTNIAEANEISVGSMALVVESKANMETTIEEAIELSKEGDKSLLEDCELAVKLINKLKQDGINVVLTH